MAVMTPSEFAAKLHDETYLTDAHQTMTKATLIAEYAIKRRTRVRTGHLRRSMRGTVMRAGSIIRGRVGSPVDYLAHQINDPIAEGFDDVQTKIIDMFQRFNNAFIQKITR